MVKSSCSGQNVAYVVCFGIARFRGFSFAGCEADSRHFRLHRGFARHEVHPGRGDQGRPEAAPGGRDQEGVGPTSDRGPP